MGEFLSGILALVLFFGAFYLIEKLSWSFFKHLFFPDSEDESSPQ